MDGNFGESTMKKHIIVIYSLIFLHVVGNISFYQIKKYKDIEKENIKIEMEYRVQRNRIIKELGVQ